MPEYIFMCPHCKSSYNEDELVSGTDGGFICPRCSTDTGPTHYLQAYDYSKIRGHSIDLQFKDENGDLLDTVEFIHTPWSPINEEKYNELIKYIRNVMKFEEA